MDKYAQLASLFAPGASTGTPELDKLFGLRPITDEELAARQADRDARIAELLGEERSVEGSATAKIPELSGSAKERAAQLAPVYQEVSAKYGVPFDLLMAQAHQESGFNPSAVSGAGAVGVAQFMPATATQYGLKDRNDPVASAHAQAKYMRHLLDMFGGDENLAIAAYNAGEGNVQKAGGIPNFKETQNYVANVRQLRGLYGGQGAPIQSPAGSPADQLLPAQPQIDPSQFDLVTLTNGAEAYIKKGLSPEEIVGKLQAQGIDALPTRSMKTPSGQDVLVRFNMSDDEALAKLKEQQPDLMQRPRGLPEEDKSGYLSAAKKGLLESVAPISTGLGGEAKRLGEYLGPESTIGQYATKAGTTMQEYGAKTAKRAEEAFKMPEDASWLEKNIAYPMAEGAGQLVPYGLAFGVPGGALGTAAGLTTLYGGAMGEAEQKAKEVGKEFVPEEARPWAGADVALNMVGLRMLGPLKNVFGPEAVEAPQAFVRGLIEKEGIEGAKAKMGSAVTDVLKGMGVTGGANIANEVAEDMLYRGYAGQDLFNEDALQSYLSTAKQVAPIGVGMGAVHGVAQRSAKVEALTREEEQKAAAEAEAGQISREQETRLAEDMKGARVNYEKLGIETPDALTFPERRQAFDDYIAGREAEKETVRAELPEDLQQLPLNEAQLLQKARGEQEKYYAPLGLPERGKNIAVKRRALEELDINNPAHAPTIGKVLDEIEASNIPHNVEGMKFLRQRLSEVPSASEITSTIPSDGRGVEGPQGSQEIGYPTVGGEGVRPSDQEGQGFTGEIREVKGAEKVKSAAEVFEPERLEQIKVPGYKSRDKLVEMPIQDFLKLAEKIDEPVDFKESALDKSLSEGEKLREIPQLWFAKKDGQQTVTGHEGRHRAMALLKRGYTHMPVLMRSGDIRWSEQAEPKKFDYQESWPDTLKSEQGDIVPFPIKREEAESEYTPATKIEAPEIREVKGAPKEIEIEGVKRPTTDSTGAPIHTTEEGVKNFWKGFAGTKVVDEQGRPQRMYRGALDDLGETGAKDEFIHFSSDPKIAQGYERGFVDPELLKEFGIAAPPVPSGLRVVPAYLSIKNPASISDAQRIAPDARTIREALPALKKAGFDGFISDYETIAFDKNQIKSATGNVGTFDTTKPEIREAGRYPDIGKLKLDINQFQDAKDSKTLLNRYMEHGSDEGLKTLANMFASSRHAPAIKVKFVTPETAPKIIAQRFKKGAGAVTAVDQQGATMYFRADKPENFSEDFILHENIHGMTIGALKRSPHMRNEFNRLNTAIGNALRDASSKAPEDADAKNLSDFWDHVTKDNPDELLTYGLTSPTFRELFKNYAADGRPLTAARTEAQKGKVRVRPDQPPSEGPTRPVEMTLLQRFTDFVRRLFGISEKNKKAFEDALAQYEQRQADYEQHIKDYETIKPLHAHMHERLKTLLDITEREGVALPSGRQVISKAPGARKVDEEKADFVQPTPEEQAKLVEEAKKSGLTAIAQKGGLGSTVGSMMSEMANKGILLPFQTAVFDERAPIANALNKLGANVGKKLRADSIWGAYSQRFNTIQQGINDGYTMMGPDGTLEAIENSQLAPQKIFDRVRKYGKQLGMSEGDAWKVVSEMLVRLRAGTIRDQDAKTRQDARNYLSAADELDSHAASRTTSDEKRKFREAANKLRRQAQEKLDSIGDDGRTYVSQEEVEAGRKLYMAYKDTLSREVDNIHELLRKIPDKLEAAGMIDAKTAEQYRNYPFYFPFYDRAKFDEEVLDPLKEETLQRYLGGMGRGLKSVAEVKRQESHGHTIYTADNLLRHLMYWDSAVAEHGARTATCEQLEMTGGATRLMGEPSDRNFVVKVKRGGKDTYYKIHDPNVYYAFQASAPITGPIVNALRKMSRFQRGVAVFNPLFWYKQIIRDPKQVSRIGKVGMITPFDALGELSKIVAGKSKGYERIVAKGVVGPVDIGSNPHERIRSLVQGKGFSSKVYHKLNEIHEAVDAATRAIVYDRALAKYKKWGIGDDVADALAIKDAREVMNFSRKGKNQQLNLLRSVTPFLGSYINSIDVLLKAMSPETYGKLSKADAMEMRRTFLGISSSIATLSLGYSLLMSDDEEWVNNADRNGNILIRNPFSNNKEKPFIMLPLEFEVGWLQHTLPENMMLANLGAVAPTTEKANLKESAAKALMPPMDFFSYARPLITAALQYEDSRTPGAAKRGYEGLKQFEDERATEFSKMMADELEKAGIQMFSPNDIEKYMNDFFGGYWSVAQSASAYMLAHKESGAVAPAKTMTEMLPWFGKAFSGEYRDVAVRDAFNVLEDVQKVQNTFSKIKATKNLSKYNEFIADPEFVKAAQADKALNGLSEKMSSVSTKIATVIADENIKDPNEKRRIIDELNGQREEIAKEVLKRAKAAGVFE